MTNKSIADRLLSAFKGMEFTLKQAYAKCTGVNNESVRARIYENLGIKFLRVRKGVYVAKDQDCVLIEGDGRDLSILEDKSIDCIITDHPWLDKKLIRAVQETLHSMTVLSIHLLTSLKSKSIKTRQFLM